MSTQTYPLVSSNPNVQAFYEALRDKGESHNMADLLAHQQPPAANYSNTDRAFAQNFDNDPVPFIPEKLKGEVIANVERAGIKARGKVYCGKLADTRGPLDPEAWVGSVEDVKRVAEKRNLTVTGAINYQGTVRQTPDIPLAEDLIQKHMKTELTKRPKADKKSLRQEIIEKHAPKWSN